ncbi:hypothetical protein RB595_003671 [Gaeumannomyces hyphopodioides]
MSSNTTDLEYRRHEDRASDGIPITIVCTATALIFVALRIYTRAILVEKVYWEDYTSVAALAFSIVLGVFIVIAFTNGAGRHFETVTEDEFVRIWKFAPAVYTAYQTTHTLCKLSIILQYIRISVMPFEKRFCYAFAAFLGCGFFAAFIELWISCIPFYAIWTPNVPGAVCINSTVDFAVWQTFFIVMDFAILICPLFILRHLTISWPQRVLLGLILAFGAMAGIVSILRLQLIFRSTTSTDKTWDSVPSGLYAVVEVNLGIACSCVVTLRPLFGRWFCLSRGGKAEQPQQVEPQSQKPRQQQQQQQRRNPFSADTDSTRILTDDVELGTMYATTSCAGSTKAGSGTAGEGGENPSIEAPSPVRVKDTTTSFPPSPARSRAAVCPGHLTNV